MTAAGHVEPTSHYSGRPLLITWIIAHWGLVAFAAVTLLFLANSFIYFGWGQDDPGILFRYALNFAEGRGLVYNPGERVEGYSDFGYVILMSIAYKVLGLAGRPEVLFLVSKFVGLICSILALWLTYLLATRFLRLERNWALFACFMLAVSAPFAIWSVGALETNCLALLLLASLFLYLNYLRLHAGSSSRSNVMRTSFLCGITLCVLTLMRADAFVYVLIIAGHWSFSRLRLREICKADWPLLLLPTLAALIYEVWRLWYYGYPLPNSYYAKVQPSVSLPLLQGAFQEYLEPYLHTLGGIGSVGGLMALSVYKDKKHASWFLAFVCASYTGYVLVVGGDWMAGYRFLVPIVPIILLLMVSGARHLIRALGIKFHNVTTEVVLCLLTAGLIAAAQIYPGIEMVREWKQSFVPWYAHPTFEARRLVPYGDMAAWVSEHAEDSALLATHQAGFIPLLTGLRAIDTFGVTDATLAHMWADPQGVQKGRAGILHWLQEEPSSAPAQRYIVDRRPDLYVIYSRWNRNLTHTAQYLVGGEYVLLDSELYGYDVYIPSGGTDKVLINVAAFENSSTSYSSRYDTGDESEDPFEGGTWTSGCGDEAWIQSNFGQPYMVEQITIEAAGTDITTDNSLIELMLLNLDDEFVTVATLRETNVNWATASDGGALNSISEYRFELTEALLAKGFKMDLKGHGWFLAEDVRVLGRVPSSR